MFVGHAAVALAAKKTAPKVSLGWLFAAVIWLDMVWPIFLLLGIERVRIDPGNTAFTPLDFVHYPWTHSLVMALGWSVLFAVVAGRFVRDRRAQLLLGLLVLSHWVLDVASHRPDMPLWPGDSPMLGLGLWYSVPATLIVEGALFAAGLWIYVAATTPRDGTGRYGFWSLIGLMAIIWISGPFSAPPPSANAIASVGLALWLLPVWAWWADRHRRATNSPA